MVEKYKEIILKGLLENEIIDETLYEKCSAPEYIQSLPYDNRTRDIDKLKERKEAIKNKLDEITPDVHSLYTVMEAVRNTRKQLKDVDNGMKNVRKYDKKIDKTIKEEIKHYQDSYDEKGEDYIKEYLEACKGFKKRWDDYNALEKKFFNDVKKFYNSKGSKEFNDANYKKFEEIESDLVEFQKQVPMLFYTGGAKANDNLANWRRAHFQIQKGIRNSRKAWLNEDKIIKEETARLDQERSDLKKELAKVNENIKKAQNQT